MHAQEPTVIIHPTESTADMSAQSSSEKLYTTTEQDPRTPHPSNRLLESARSFLPLSIIAFGGPPAHIALLHNTFVVRKKWLDDTLFGEYFAVSQALPGPGSTEMLFSIAIHRGGILAGLVGFVCWSIPGLIIMTAFGLGVSHLPSPLPNWLIHLQNGISAAVVGLVAQAGTSLARKIVVNKDTLAVCTLAACAAVLWSASWLEPVVIAVGGILTFVLLKCHTRWDARRAKRDRTQQVPAAPLDLINVEVEQEPQDYPAHNPISWKTGVAIIIVWLILLIVCMVLKPHVASIRPIAILAQFFVAGCVIFGGGPVVIPLLYSYVVVPGWLSERDFLLGVALIQALPGPNFNFAAYCGALALAPYGAPAAIGGALLGYIGIFTPGLALNAAAMPLWARVRKSKVLVHVLPGMNAAAVGLVYAAAYLLWQKGVVRGDVVRPLGDFPFYAVVAGVAYVLVDAGTRTVIVMILGCLAGLLSWGLGI
ncbi:hypothetical protein SpCBS45565_g05245 [Spizellomyces sp. 'palustris']|nr:hypothetical protein SpCBS45565_g05245 [Spizellomyces sp. 'palustris']